MSPSQTTRARQAHPSPQPARPRLRFSWLPALIAAICISLATPQGAAQTSSAGTVEGRILNASSGNYLNNARVRVKGTTIEAFTDAFGEYRLTGVPAGPVTLEVFYTGLPSQTAMVTVAAQEVARQDFRLGFALDSEDETIFLEAFTVTSAREYDARAIAINEQRFSANLRNVVSTDAFGEVSQGNLGEFMKHIPGVTIEYSGQNASGIQVRGFGSNYTGVTLDGGTIASAASPASTQNHSRSFGLEQANINNLSRIEVVKLPTPDFPSNLLGGAVNLVSKSAFERERAELRVSTYLSFNSEYLDLEETAGPGRDKSFKIRPSIQLTWSQPINKRLGIVVTAASVNTFSQTQETAIGRTWTDGGATLANPRTNTFRGDLNLNLTERNSGGIKLDWKPWDRHVLSLSLQANAFVSNSRQNRVSFNPATYASWDETTTIGTSTTNSNANQSATVDEKHGLTQAVALNYRFTGEDWNVEAGFNRSTSWNRNRDTDKGFFRNYTARARAVRQINFRNINNGEGSPGVIELLDASGNPLEVSSLNNYLLETVTSQPSDAEDRNTNGRVAVTRHIRGLPFSLSFKAGGAYENLKRDINYQSFVYNYIGPGGALSNPANVATPYLDSSFGAISPGYTYPAIQFASPWLIYEAYRNNPGYFVQTTSQANDSIKNAAVRSPALEETITAGYLMADMKFWQNRLRVVGGVRYELTETEGYGYKQTLTGYERRGYYNSREYDGYYPSAHVTFNITEDLILRAAYAKTIGRPPTVDIVPNVYIGENTGYNGAPGTYPGWITSANTTLVPWEADNGDLTLQYYLPRSGMISVGVFRKNISNFFGTLATEVDAAIAASLGLSSDYIGWYYSTRINAGDARIDGFEASYEQSLGMFGSWGEPYSIFANYTKLDLDGQRAADFKDFIPETANLGVRANFKRVTAFAKWNYRGRQLREYKNNIAPGAGEYIRAYPTIDVNLEVMLTRNLSLFATARNLLNEAYEWEIDGPGVPAWSTLSSRSVYGTQYTLGVKGTF